jgi:TctA family transporter
MSIKIDDDNTILVTGSPRFIFTIPAALNGLNLTAVSMCVTTVSSSGLPTVQLRNITDSTDMLSTTLTIDANELHSKDATAAVIDTTKDDVVTGDRIGVNVTTAGTGAKGLQLDLTFG